MTDVPSMALTKKSGGHTLAVFNPKVAHSKDICSRLLHAGRVDFIAPADYRDGSKLSKRCTLLLDSVIAEIAYAAEVAACNAEHPAQ